MNRIVTLGEIMTRISTPGATRFAQSFPGQVELSFGGAEANAAVSAAQFGSQVAFVTALPANPIGHACVANLNRFGVDTSQVVMQDTGRMGTFFYEAGVNQRAGQVIYDRADSCFAVSPPETYNWDAVFADANTFVLSGITPAISEQACRVARSAMNEARRRDVSVAFDINYRSKLWRWRPGTDPEDLASEVLGELVGLADLLICGFDDGVRFLGCGASATIDDVFQELASRYSNLKWISTSVRTIDENQSLYGGVFFISETRTILRAPSDTAGYQIGSVVDRLGIGDTFAGGLVHKLSGLKVVSPQEAEDAIQFATAAGCLAHSLVGDFGLLSADEVASLVSSGDQTGRVQR